MSKMIGAVEMEEKTGKFSLEALVNELDSLWLETEKAVSGITEIDSSLYRKARLIIKINTIYSCILESPSFRCHYDSIRKLCDSLGANIATWEGRRVDDAKKNIESKLRNLSLGEKKFKENKVVWEANQGVQTFALFISFDKIDDYGVTVTKFNKPNSEKTRHNIETHSALFAYLFTKHYEQFKKIHINYDNLDGILKLFCGSPPTSIDGDSEEPYGLLMNMPIEDRIIYAYCVERNFNISFYCTAILKILKIGLGKYKTYRGELEKNKSEAQDFRRLGYKPDPLSEVEYLSNSIDIVGHFWKSTRQYIVLGYDNLLDLLLDGLYKNLDLSDFDRLIHLIPELVEEYEDRIIPAIKRYTASVTNEEAPIKVKKGKKKVDSINQPYKELYKTVWRYWGELTGYNDFNWTDKLRESLTGHEKEAESHFDNIVTFLRQDELPRVFRKNYEGGKKITINLENQSTRIE